MKKFALLCCGMLFGATALFAAPMDMAVRSYQKNQIDGFCVGLKLRGINVSPAQRAQIATLSDGFIVNTVLPVLKKHRLEATWIKCQLDPELNALYAKTFTIDNEKELRGIINSIIDTMNKKYPILINTVFADPEYQAGFQKLRIDLNNIINR